MNGFQIDVTEIDSLVMLSDGFNFKITSDSFNLR